MVLTNMIWPIFIIRRRQYLQSRIANLEALVSHTQSLLIIFRIIVDCRGLWEPQMTYFGKCMQFSTFQIGEELLELGKKEIQMSVVASYNTSGE